MKRLILALILTYMTFQLSGCAQYGGGTSGTGLNFRENVRQSNESEAEVTAATTAFRGKLIDEKSRPLKNAEILLEASGNSRRVFTNERGEFEVSLELSTSRILSISLPGKAEKFVLVYRVPEGPEPLSLCIQRQKNGELKVLN